jgi:hypothetical protein
MEKYTFNCIQHNFSLDARTGLDGRRQDPTLEPRIERRCLTVQFGVSSLEIHPRPSSLRGAMR